MLEPATTPRASMAMLTIPPRAGLTSGLHVCVDERIRAPPGRVILSVSSRREYTHVWMYRVPPWCMPSPIRVAAEQSAGSAHVKHAVSLVRARGRIGGAGIRLVADKDAEGIHQTHAWSGGTAAEWCRGARIGRGRADVHRRVGARLPQSPSSNSGWTGASGGRGAVCPRARPERRGSPVGGRGAEQQDKHAVSRWGWGESR